MNLSFPISLRALGLAAALAGPLLAQNSEYPSSASPGSGGAGERRVQQQASDLIGATVKSTKNEKIGTVEDLLVDLDSGRVLGVVISPENDGGGGRQPSVVSPESLHRGGAEGELRMDREKLRTAPRLKREMSRADPQDRDNGGGAASVFRRGRETEEEGARTEADNTARNRRDRDDRQTLAPLDQGNKRSDIRTTARIRSAVVDREGLSTNAKNVKIITRDGQVTLRGPVATEEEKRIIAEIAEQVAGGARVSNQLEVARK